MKLNIEIKLCQCRCPGPEQGQCVTKIDLEETERRIEMKLSELSGALDALCTRVAAVEQAIKDRPAGDPELGTTNETSLTALTDKVTSLEATVTPPTP